MKQRYVAAAWLTAMMFAGCSSHLLFVEEDHLGLKAKFQPNDPSPVELSVGYHRGVIAIVPQQSEFPSGLTNQVTVTRTDGTNTMVITYDPDELMSLYTVFRANVGWMDPIETHHFLVTGTAAASLLANEDSLRNIVTNLQGFADNKGQ
ncbi:MAG: hypothetical protein ABSH14_16345 [Verrucomicrobiia bacterium]|jgi:hypothetical protein